MGKKDDNEIIIYQGEDGQTHIDVKFTDKTVWLSQQQMAELYQTTRPNIVQHIRNIYADEELDELSTCKNFLQVRQEGFRQVSREIPFYNLDMIISLGYRIRSKIATHFRRFNFVSSLLSSEPISTQSSLSTQRLKPTEKLKLDYITQHNEQPLRLYAR